MQAREPAATVLARKEEGVSCSVSGERVCMSLKIIIVLFMLMQHNTCSFIIILREKRFFPFLAMGKNSQGR